MTARDIYDHTPTVDEIRTWGATVDVPVACAAFGISKTCGYELIKRGEFPAKVMHFGRRTRVVTASILAVLSDRPDGPAIPPDVPRIDQRRRGSA